MDETEPAGVRAFSLTCHRIYKVSSAPNSSHVTLIPSLSRTKLSRSVIFRRLVYFDFDAEDGGGSSERLRSLLEHEELRALPT